MFILNSAGEEGGAIKWGGLIPNSSFNQFISNKAVYGENIAAYPMKIGLIIQKKSQDSFCVENEISSINNNNNNEFLYNLDCVSSGNIANYILQIKILDIYSNVVSNLNGK